MDDLTSSLDSINPPGTPCDEGSEVVEATVETQPPTPPPTPTHPFNSTELRTALPLDDRLVVVQFAGDLVHQHYVLDVIMVQSEPVKVVMMVGASTTSPATS